MSPQVVPFDEAVGPPSAPPKADSGIVSFEEATASDAPARSTFPAPKKGSSAQDIQFQLYNRPSKYKHTIDAIEKGVQGVTTTPVMNWWHEYGRQVDAQTAAVKADVNYLTKEAGTDKDTGMFSGPITEAKTLWDALGLLWTPVSAAVTSGLTKPTAEAADPYYRKQSLAAGHTPEEADRSVQAINEAIDTVYQMAAGMALGGKPGETPKVEPAAPGEIRVPRSPPKGPKEELPHDPRPLIEQIKSTKDEIRKLTEKNATDEKIAELEGKLAAHHTDMIFEELATKNPEAANILASKVAEIAPRVGKQMKMKVKLKQKASPEEQMIVGKDAAQAKILGMEASNNRWVDDPWGMPGEAESVLTNGGPVEWAPAAIQRLSKGEKDTFGIYSRQGEKLGEFDTIEAAKAHAEKLFPTGSGKVIKGGLMPAGDNPMATGLWENLHNKMTGIYNPLISSSRTLAGQVGEIHPQNVKLEKTPGTVFLDHMIDSLPADTLSARTAFQKTLLRSLRKAVGDVTVQFIPDLKHTDETGLLTRYKGYYQPDSHRIFMNSELGAETTDILVHEFTHAASSRFLIKNPDHPFTLEMNRLYEEAKRRLSYDWAKYSADPRTTGMHPPETPYGMKDVHEFLAEAFTNRDFQKWLADSERNALGVPKGKTMASLWNRLAALVQKMLGLDGKYLPLLHRTMSVGEKIIQAQGRDPSTALLRDASAGIREASGSIHAAILDTEKKNPSELGAFERIGSKLPSGVNVAIGKLAEYNRQLRGVFMPRTLGPGAEAAATLIQEATAKRAQHMLMLGRDSFKRRNLWNKLSEGDVVKWMQGVELGAKFKDPGIQTMSEGYRRWGDDIYRQDMRTGFDYDPVDHYIPRLFKSGPKIPIEDFMQRKFGSKWKSPGFIKDRGFKMIDDAIKAGYKLKFTNPEDMMLARQFSSDTAEMQVNILRDLEANGFAVKAQKDSVPPEGYTVQRRSPTGETYWLNRDSAKVVRNAFDTYSLWNDKTGVGDTFRGLMYVKNLLIPIRLSGLFHVTHVGFAIDTAAAFTRLNRELLSGKAVNTPKAFGEFLKTGMPVVSSFWTNPRKGWRIMQAYKGNISPSKLSAADLEFLQYANEGGFVPFLDRQWKTNAEQKFMDAIHKHQARAIVHAPGALIGVLNKPVFEMWIPSLKMASYMSEVETLFRLRPELLDQPFERRKALGQVNQMIDRRFGEMALNNQFWPRWVKDVAVLNTLSIGWQLGVIGEFGGGALDLAKMPFRGSPKEQLRTGQLNKTLYAAGYTAVAMGYTGLLSYGLSGVPPTGEDFIWPRAGGTNPDGSPKRLSTPFFTREFGSIYKHIRDEGVGKATTDIIASKSSGMVALATEAALGVNSMGQEIRDPNAPGYKKLEQSLHYMLRDIEPIAASQPADTGRDRTLNIVGFTPAPKYVTDSPTTAQIKSTFHKYHGGSLTPYSKAIYSDDLRTLRQLDAKGDTPGYYKQLDSMQDKFNLTDKEVGKLEDAVQSGLDPTVKMFRSLTWQQQKKLLDDMTPEERETYLPVSNVEHLRDNYEDPK